MNRGEGLKIAARAKHGSVGLFQEDKKPKKKFSYKSRSQNFSVRKVHTNLDNKDVDKIGTKTNSRTTASGKNRENKTTDNADETDGRQKIKHVSKNSGSKESALNKKKLQQDFIKKNKTLGVPSSGAGKASSGMGGANTIALTQEQLNSILQSIGAVSGGAPAISIEDGQIKINEKAEAESKDSREKEKIDNDEGSENQGKYKNKRTSAVNNNNDDNRTVVSENLLQLLQQVEVDSDKVQTESSSKPPSLPRTPSKTDEDIRGRESRGLQQKKELTWGTPVGMGNIGAVVGQQRSKGLSLQEQRQQEWKKALDDQIAEKKKQRKQEENLRKSYDGNGLDLYQRRKSPQHIERNSPMINTKKDAADNVVVYESSLGQVTKQSNIPAAMRSNIFFGGSCSQRPDSHNAELKRQEQQEWLQELERQKQETAVRKQCERKKQNEDSAIEHWTDSMAHMNPTGLEKPHETNQQDDLHISQSKQHEHPKSYSPASNILSPRQSKDMPFARGGLNSLVDPGELERRDKARQKHLEHMRAIQEQVEEKQKLKREAEEQRKREEAEEERRLANERETLQKQFEMENNKKRKKEEAAAANQKALEDSIQNAEREALAAKHAKRAQKLSKQGHDTTNLRKSWDAQQPTETTPRQQIVHSSQKHHLVQHSPPPPPRAMMETQTFSSNTTQEEEISEFHGEKRDVGTSTVTEQSTQTGYEYIHHGALSPRLLEAIQQASAGIEYRPSGGKPHSPESEEHNERKKKPDRGYEKEGLRRKTDKHNRCEETERPARQKKQSEKPRWGQTNTKKKISNSDKDLSKISKGREERRRKRQEELLAQQERLMRRRDNLKKRTPTDLDLQSEITSSRSGSGRGFRVEDTSRGHSRNVRDEDDHKEVVHVKAGLGNSPGMVEGDFYPFLRSEDVQLDNRSVSITPVTEGTNETQDTYIDNNVYPPAPIQMDPLLNPEIVRDGGQRQEQILEQLSHLRQGLMMKQREIELGLSPSMMM